MLSLTVSETFMNQQKVERMKCPVCGTPTSELPAPCPRCALVDELIEELIRRQTRDSRMPAPRLRPMFSLCAVESGAH